VSWFSCWLAILGIAGILAACQIHSTDKFPTLGTTTSSDSQASQTSGSQPTESGGQKKLTVALPLSNDAFEAVRLLYLAKKSNLLNQEPGQYIGQQIDPEDLKQFDTGLDITLYSVPLSTGATMLQVSTWQAAAMLPDIIYCQDVAASVGLDQILPLDELLYENRLLSATHIYASLLDSVRVDQKLIGIPFLVSTALIYQNINLIRQLQLEFPEPDWTWGDWRQFSELAQAAIGQAGLAATPDSLAALAETPENIPAQLGRALFVTDNPAAMLAYLPASYAENPAYAMWNGQAFQLNSPIFKASASWLRQYVVAGYSLLHLDSAQTGMAFGLPASASYTSARTSGRIIMWTGDSTELREWRQQSKFQVAASFMPAGIISETADKAILPAITGGLPNRRFPVTVRALFLSKKCQDPQLAADFTAFLALDADSLLMQSRYQLYEGMFPVIQDQVVWQALVARQQYGSFLINLRQRIPDAYCSGQQQIPVWQNVLQIIQQERGVQMLKAADDAHFNDELAQLQYAVSRKMKGR
jgi:ABC-type glycerol-3-phosphate transport system substrate-binding protein